MTFARPDKTDTTPAQTTRAPDRGQIITELRDLFERNGTDASFAATFVSDICQPCTQWENPRMVAAIGGGNRWEYPYQTRIILSAHTWLALKPREREIIAAGATEDGIRWRGEPVNVYIEAAGETLRMRQVGIRAYVADSAGAKELAKLRKAGM